MARASPALRVYLDTSVLGGCFDKEFAPWSIALMGEFRRGHMIPLMSEILAAEVVRAPQHVRDLHAELLDLVDHLLPASADAERISDEYMARGAIGKRYRADPLHIALATIAAADALASWIFKHIVRLDKIRVFNQVNVDLGYRPLNIYSPREIAPHEET